VNSIHIVCSYSHKPHDKSQAGVLIALLRPDIKVIKSGKNKQDNREPGIIYERGDPDWFAVKEDAEAKPDDGIDRSKIDQYYLDQLTDKLHQPLSRTPKSMRGMSRVQPSNLEGGNRVKLAETLTSPDRDLALEFGQLIHRCFERIHWIDQEQQVSDADLHQHLQRFFHGSDQIEPAIARFRQLLQHENLTRLLSTAANSDSPNRVEVHTEKRLAVLMDQAEQGSSEHGSLIEGIVDRLVLVYKSDRIVAAEVVDFKYDQIDDTNLTQRIEFYRPQLVAYRSAVETMFGLAADRISTRLVFVQTGQVVHVSQRSHRKRNPNRPSSKPNAPPRSPPKSSKHFGPMASWIDFPKRSKRC